MAVCVRLVSIDIHSAQIAFARCALGFLIVLPMLIPHGGSALRTSHLGVHLLRGVLAVIGMNAGYYALSVLPLVTVTALFFTAPLFVPVLAVLLVKERVGWQRWVATGVGFVGTLVVLGFDREGFRPAMLIALIAALTLAISLVLGKKLSVNDKPVTLLIYFSFVSALGSLPGALLVWEWPDLSQFLLLLGVAVFATLRSYFDIRGYAIGEASFVAPFFYARILFVGGVGYLLFGEVPAGNAVVGVVIIVVATLYIVRVEIKRGGSAGMLSG